MQNLAVYGYTQQQVIDALHAKYRPRNIKFRYDLLDKNEVRKSTLSTVINGSIAMQYDADIKRTGKFKIEDDGTINWLNDRIQPFFMLQMPDGGWASWSLGIFLLSSPTRVEENNKIYREIEAYDGLQVLKDDKFSARYTILAGTDYFTSIIAILQGAGITKYNIQQINKSLPITKEWEPGTEKLKAVNELLSDLNFTPVWVDEIGFYTSQLYQSPSIRGINYTYSNDSLSVTYNGMQDTLDLFSIPNVWTRVSSNAESTPLISTYTNNNPSSLTSTVSRGRTILSYETIDTVADQASLDSKVQRLAFEASQIFGQVVFNTALMPMHSYNDILQINYSYLGISDKYSEIGWSMPLNIGGQMQHNIRKVVNI
jgi:hypothetical protein